ncbi:hypothetical protein [Aquabacterium sp. A08]|uniref:hypothetical protein n=1 Tax=Aquabacterium sp. A08 TaxID=2718532 RepID=UPI00141FE4A9|nr:hypothetical protein [Aquabacterium sp. A08]NIC40918.1 hypothetical protein [Aquabacterium sp. A08]NIC43649.1 hypothetical protein [Aquabacterium sp. A08]
MTPHHRTGWRAVNAAWFAGWLAWAMTGLAQATSPTPPNDCAHAPPLRPVAPGVWVWEGQVAEVAPSNGGHVVSNVVLAHPTRPSEAPVTVLDPGPSHRHGLALDRAVRCQLGAPVARVIHSHGHAENVLGSSAFAAAALLATDTTRATMAQRCPDCLAHLTHTAGPEALAGTRIVLPTQPLVAPHTLRLTDRVWHTLEWRNAHTQSDLVLWQPDTRVLLAAGLVYPERLPELAQGTVQGWLAALDGLAALRPRVVVGQQVGGALALHRTRQYLCDLTRAVWSAMDSGASASDAEALALPAYAHWVGYAERQGFNAQRAWRELEPWWIEGRRPRCSGPDVGR